LFHSFFLVCNPQKKLIVNYFQKAQYDHLIFFLFNFLIQFFFFFFDFFSSFIFARFIWVTQTRQKWTRNRHEQVARCNEYDRLFCGEGNVHLFIVFSSFFLSKQFQAFFFLLLWWVLSVNFLCALQFCTMYTPVCVYVVCIEIVARLINFFSSNL